MNETLFYLFGIALVLSALLAAFVGLRFEGFPATPLVLAGVVVYFASLVAATTTFAVLNAADEQHEREAEEAAAQEATTTQGQTTTAAANGEEVFTSEACPSCHTLKAAGSTGTIGPDLDDALKGKTSDFIRESIVKPNAFIAKGYPANTMPQNFGQTLSSAQLDALVSFLAESTGAKQ